MIMLAFGVSIAVLLSAHLSHYWIVTSATAPFSFPEIHLTQFVLNLLVIVKEYLVAAGFGVAIWAIGWISCGWISVRRGLLGRWLIEFGAGLIVASIGMLGLGQVGLLFPAIGILIAIIVVPYGVLYGVRLLRSAVDPWKVFKSRSCMFGLFVLPIVPWIITGPILSAPSVDNMEYHHGLPVLWAMNHKIFVFPWNMFHAFPLGLERIYLWMLLCKISNAFMPFCVIILGISAVALTRGLTFCGVKESHVAGWMLFGCAAALNLAWDGHPDVGQVLGTSLIFLAFVQCAPVSMGLACGFAVLCKYLGGAIVLSFATVLLFRSKRFGVSLRTLVVVASLTLVVNLGWMLHNVCTTGNVIYPFGSQWLPSLGWNACDSSGLWEQMKLYRVDAIEGVGGYAKSFWFAAKYFLSSPYVVLMYMAPVVLLLRRASPMGRLIAAQLLIWAAIWIFPIPKLERYLIPGIVPLIAMLFLVFNEILSRRVGWIFSIFVVLQSYSFIKQAHDIGLPPEKVLVGEASRRDYSRARLGSYTDAVEWINKMRGSFGKIMVVGEGHSYGSTLLWFANNGPLRPIVLQAAGEYPSPGRMRIRLRQAGIKWILYNPVRAYYLHGQTLCHEMSEQWLTAYAELYRRSIDLVRPPQVYDWTGAWAVYQVRSKDREASVEGFLPWLPGAERLHLNEDLLKRGLVDYKKYERQQKIIGDFGIAKYQKSMVSYYVEKNAGAAINEAKAAFETGLRSPNVCISLGYMCFMGKMYEAARDWFKQALVIDPKNQVAKKNYEGTLIMIAQMSRQSRQQGK